MAVAIAFFQYLLHQFALQFRQVLGEVVRNLALRLIELGINTVDKSITTQSLFNGFSNVEQGLLNSITFGNYFNMMSPRYKGKWQRF